MHHDEVRKRDAAQRREHRRAQQALRQTTAGVHAALRPTSEHDASRPGRSPRPARRPVRRDPTAAPSVSRSPARCAAVTSGNSTGAASTSPGSGRTGRVDRGRVVAEGDDGHGPLVHPIGADERGDPGIREAAVQPRGEPCGVGHREQLREHGARIPVHVPEATFAVAPPGAPRDAGDHEGGRTGSRRRPNPNEGVVERVVPVHPRGQLRALGHGDVDLEREATARGPGGAEQPGPVRPLHRAHDPRGQVQQPGEVRQVHLRAGDLGGARHHGDRRRRRGGEVPRERQAGQRPLVPLVEPREAIQVVHLEVLQHARIVDRARPTRGRARRTSAGAAPASRSPCLHLRASFVRSAPALSWPAM